MFRRGQEAQQHNDFAAARRWYEAAAEHGHRDAALALGRLYDPNVLRDLHILGSTAGDPAAARKWYQQAADLGHPLAPLLLKTMSAPGSPGRATADPWTRPSPSIRLSGSGQKKKL
jgi:TPR repeat protein